VDSNIGQGEVDQESDTQNGDTNTASPEFRVIDGVKLNNFKNKKIKAAFKGGYDKEGMIRRVLNDK
jgi:hypothetical protein